MHTFRAVKSLGGYDITAAHYGTRISKKTSEVYIIMYAANSEEKHIFGVCARS
jgi:hypothetical protein